MDEGETWGGFNDWEQVKVPTHSSSIHHQSTPPAEPDIVHRGLEMSSGDEAEVNSSVASNNGDEPNSGPLKKANEFGRILSNGVVKVAARLGYYLRILPFGATTGILAALLVPFVYAKMRKWRARVKEEKKDPLILLIQEKDQMINKLLIQIAHMKELISTRRRVPVLRNISRPGPRSGQLT
ncbi:uncharacterized protein LOC105764489 isoform X1 [Gossypium raimondii]|uniref:Uncharacterized protein n=1 Tax=Gossypium raimondii TaxID=29730 RepID=A0A0D2U557_GOSRA|nr:uncharacterized protein LOC105764489 isoform X1 [Gossypium raimondii]KJB50605.1 hypothetical protein B456_008G179000 [Gossypium raimondii]